MVETSPKRRHVTRTPSESDASIDSDRLSGESVAPRKCNFLLSWTKFYPWVTTEGTGDNMVVVCKLCRKAKLTNDFAEGKKCPKKGWKREYLQRHADSDDHVKHAVSTVRTAQHAQATNMFQLSSSASEKQTIGLMQNVFFLAKNGLAIYRASPLHFLVDCQLSFYFDKESLLPSWSHRAGYSSREFIHAMNTLVENVDENEVKNAYFVSLLIDESNDISI